MWQREAFGPFVLPREAAVKGKSLFELVALARQAFEEKRERDCFDLTRAALKIDPNHSEAREIHSCLQAGLEQDLSEARRLVEGARLPGDLATYARAEALLRRVVNIDFTNTEASHLLERVVRTQFAARSAAISGISSNKGRPPAAPGSCNSPG
jgi:hypothetical protein